MNMFGGVCAMVNGHMMGGLFGRSALVRLSPDDQKEALALDGAEPFDPMGNGRPMADTIFLPESIMDEPVELASWMRRGLDYTASLPPKPKKSAAAKPAAKSKPAAKAKVKAAKPAAKAKPATKAKAKPAVRSKAAARAPASKSRRVARPSKRR
jgi:TfoX/Sxy family transcriptional regulator of competence genes